MAARGRQSPFMWFSMLGCRLYGGEDGDYRPVATRYDKLARKFLAGAFIGGAVTWWLN